MPIFQSSILPTPAVLGLWFSLVFWHQMMIYAADEIARYKNPIISRITWMEVPIGANDDEESRAAREFLRLFRIEELGEDIAEEAVRVRQDKRLRLPDAIIYATASLLGCQLVTRNVEDFSAADPLVRVPYSVLP